VIHKYGDVIERNRELEKELKEAKEENSSLTQKILKLQSEIENIKKDSEGNLFNSINAKERENLKLKLQNLISKIDYHLSS